MLLLRSTLYYVLRYARTPYSVCMFEEIGRYPGPSLSTEQYRDKLYGDPKPTWPCENHHVVI